MPGIYTRDQFAQQLAQAIENSNARRQASLDREAQRTKENAAAIANFAKALGRTYETWGQSDEDKLAALQKEREEVVAQQKYEQQVAQRNAVNEYLNTLNSADKVPADAKHMQPSGPTQTEMYAETMRGYEPSRLFNSPGYADSVLGLLDDRVELNKRLDENYEPYKLRVSMRRGLY
jgi:hypothetical protein